MIVLSLFGGMECGRIALDRMGVPITKYYASEIDKHAIKVTMANYPNTIQLGSVVDVKAEQLPEIDLLIGGSPCQGFSFAGKGLNFEDPRSKLFFEYVRLLNECKPKYFLLENVKMKKEHEQVITGLLGCRPMRVNSALVSAQNRERLYWTNIPVLTMPKDKGIMLKDITEDQSCTAGASRARYTQDGKTKQSIEIRNDSKSNSMTTVQKNNIIILDRHKSNSGLICVAGLNKNKMWLDNGKILQRNFSQGERIYSIEGKSASLEAQGGGTAGVGNCLITETSPPINYRKLTITEAERLQTVPDGYTSIVSPSQGFRMLGNGWTVDIIVHIFKHMVI